MKFFAIFLMAIWICTIEAFWDDDESRSHYAVETECPGNPRHMIQRTMEAMCQPRPTMVKLIPEPDYSFYPNYVTVQRCSGYCPVKSCMPAQKNNVTVVVMDEYGENNQCYKVLVEEHITCKCQCSVTERHCNSHQIYSKENCACECMNRRECDRENHMVWDENLCKCICNKEETCSSGREWVPSLCGCAIVMKM